MSFYAPGTPIAVMQAMDEKRRQGQGGAQPAVNPFQPMGGIGGGGMGGGSATDGLGQIDKGSKTVGTALQKAQQATKDSSEAIGGGGNPMGGNIFKTMNKGGKVKAYAKGGVVSSASSRGDGCAQRGKTKGRFI